MGKITTITVWMMYLLRKAQTNVVEFILEGNVLSHGTYLHMARNKLLINNCRLPNRINKSMKYKHSLLSFY